MGGKLCKNEKNHQTSSTNLKRSNTLKATLEKLFPRGKHYYNKEFRQDPDQKFTIPDIGGSQKVNFFLKLQNFLFPDNSFKIKILICNEKETKKYIELGTTEAKMGEEIIFNKIFLLDYIFEKEQLLNIQIFSPEDSNLTFKVDFTVARIMGSKNLSYRYKIISETEDNFEGYKKFDLVIDAKNAKESKELVKLKVNCTLNSNRNDLLKNYDLYEVFFTLNNFIDGKNYRSIYKSEELKATNGFNLFFDEIQIPKNLICERDEDQILIRFYDTKYIEFADTKATFGEIKANSGLIGSLSNSNNLFELIEKNSKQAIGKLNFSMKQLKIKTFVDYLSENLQINLIIGIDFTASNGSPHDPNSLHSFSNREPNFYERAIQSCGQILSYYDSDKIYPVFGFGAQFQGSNFVNHCFNINFTQDPNIKGLENVISEYRNSVYKLNFSGPTYFTPLIKNINNMIRYNMQHSPVETYYILMILSDGQINDMAQTCDALVEAAYLPLSVIIIGIGSADFTNMTILDGDKEPIVNSRGEKIARDIVQFVEFRKFEGDAVRLSGEVLQEIPSQVEEYYNMKN